MQLPARTAGVDFVNAAAHKLVDDLRTVQVLQADGTIQPQLGKHVEPVHLQIVCQQLWQRLPDDRTSVKPQDVQAYGNVSQALVGFYETALTRTMQQTKVNERRLRTWVDTELITPAQTPAMRIPGTDKPVAYPRQRLTCYTTPTSCARWCAAATPGTN